MIERLAELKRSWSVPLLTPHESLVVLSQSFLGATAGGVQFNLLEIPCSVSQSGGSCWGNNP
jgi:hypothetical protein